MASRSGRKGILVDPSERKAFLEMLEQDDDDVSLSSESGDGDGSTSNSPTRSKSKRASRKKKTGRMNKHGGEASRNSSDIASMLGRGMPVEEGCLVCKRDDDHGNLMLCEGCSSEYHYYCLDPPLRHVPHEEWYCDKCKPNFSVPEDDDGLERLVLALPPRFTERFGQVLWANGGSGFGWWPAAVYDPRLTVGGARDLARKNLGKKHLVYFFECHAAPFAVLSETKLLDWEMGLAEDYHLGKTALSSGKIRTEQFRAAFQVAIVELGKPIDMRLDWNHQEPEEEHLPSPNKIPPPRRRNKEDKKKKKRRHDDDDAVERKKRRRHRSTTDQRQAVPVSPASRRNLLQALERQANAANKIAADDTRLFCKILKRVGTNDINIGFVQLDSREEVLFADARATIEHELDDDSLDSSNWKFYVPSLGPISRKQETSLGPLFHFLQSTCGEQLGNGSVELPLQLIIVDEKIV